MAVTLCEYYAMLNINLTPYITKDSDLKDISKLCDITFGPGRFARTAFRLREAYNGHDDFGLCIKNGNFLVGSITFTPVFVGNEGNALLLGPLVVHPKFSGRGCGVRLIEEGVRLAESKGYKLIILVGDLSYYERFGFRPVEDDRFNFPGPVNKSRVLAKELQAGILENYKGMVHV